MRQIRPRTNRPTVLPDPIPHPVSVDLRDDRMDRRSNHAHRDHDLQAELDRTRSAVAALMGDLATLVNERERLKARLAASSGADILVFDPDDRSVVPWGFFEDDDF